MEDLVGMTNAFRQEFDDVVCLQKRHRVCKSAEEMPPQERDEFLALSPEMQAKYVADAAKFEEVTARLSDLSWTREDRDWLAQRDRAALLRRPDGEAIVRQFDQAPLLTDTRKQRIAAEEAELGEAQDGADSMNLQELWKLARRTKVPIAHC
jgi:hypothetical protein